MVIECEKFFGISRFAITFRRVDFPIPDCPIRVFQLFSEIVKLVSESNFLLFRERFPDIVNELFFI